MAILPIRKFPDPVLKQKATKIRNIDKSIHKLIEDMLETMYDAPGVGLAASQVGVPIRLIVIGNIPDQEEIVLINPEVVKKKGERVVSEGCLSIPGYTGEVNRAETVTVKGIDPSGREVRIKGYELLAQALEHEIDHTNGILYIDQLCEGTSLKKVEPGKGEESEETGKGETLEI